MSGCNTKRTEVGDKLNTSLDVGDKPNTSLDIEDEPNMSLGVGDKPNTSLEIKDELNISFYCTMEKNGYKAITAGICHSNGCIPDNCINNASFNIPDSGTADLSIAYIERTPRYYHYDVVYNDGIPSLKLGTEEQKRWPENGEEVNYTAYIINTGKNTVPHFDYTWAVDNKIMETGRFEYPLEPNTVALITYKTHFANSQSISMGVDANIQEQSKANNELTIGSDDLTISIWVERGLYNIFGKTQNIVGTYSFEDWINAQFSMMNNRLSEAKYKTSPHGILDRVRIDKITIAEDLNHGFPDPDILTIDGRWMFSDNDWANLAGKSGAWQNYVDAYIEKIDFGLIHELAHQLGIIDLYRMNLANDPDNNNRISVLDEDGDLVPFSKMPTYSWGQIVFLHPGLMGGGDISPYLDGTYFESHTAAGINTNFNQRRGFYGEYLYDTPKTTSLKILDKNKLPVENAEVFLYQKDENSEIFDNIPEITGETDGLGVIELPNRPAPYVKTATGHTLNPNPFGKISVVGTNGNMFVKVKKGEDKGYGFFLLTDLNLPYWDGNRDFAQVDIETNYPLVD